MRRHPAMLKRAGITPGRYKELKGFCAQWRDYFNQTLGRPSGAAKVEWARRRMELIEQCANDVAEPVIAAAIVKSVSEGKGCARINPPMGPRQFQELRLLFFIELDRRLRET